MKRNTLIRLILLAAISVGLSSCGIWYNFKAYFNSYYNAKVLFDQVESNIEKTPKDLFAFNEAAIQAQDYLSLNKVIEKCSKILQFDTHSGYFVDALWLSGKSFYYQKEYVKAERKFKELQNNIQDQDELLKVNLWLGKTELMLRNFDEGNRILDQVTEEAIKLNENEIFSEAVVKQIAFLIYKERFDEAIDKCNKFLANSKDNEVNAEVSYELGEFYYKNNNYEKASEAFKKVSSYSPSFLTEYKSRLEYAKCQIDMGNLDQGLSLLNDLKNKVQYAKYLDEISVELGTAHYLKKDYQTAMDLFTKVDTLYYGTKSSGVAEYMKGQVYEYHLPNFDSASYYYEMASQNGLLNDEMKMQISKKLGTFSKYISMRDEIKLNRKGIEYATDKKNYLRDSVLYAEAIYKDTTEQRRRMQAMQQTGQLSNPNQVVMGQNQSGQSQMGQSQMGQSQMGQSQMGQDQGQSQSSFANQQGQTNPQSAMGQQTGTNQTLGAQQQRNSLSGTTGQGMNDRRATRTPRKKVQLEKPSRPLLSKDSLQTILSGKLYNYANLFFSELELPDSAAYYYNKILTEYPKKSVVPGTYYALGIYYQSLNQKEKADSLFKIVMNNYKSSEFAQLSAKKMKMVEDIPVVDPADSFYVAAEKKYFDKKYNEAITDFRSLMEKFPKSKRAPKAAYYIAFIYENDLKNVDSTTAAYELIAKKYPTSDVFAKTQKRNDVYQAEKAKKEKAAEELKKTTQPVNPPAAKPALTEAAATPDSIKMMMQKALQKDALKDKQRRVADSLRIVQEKQKRTTDSLKTLIEKQQ